MLYYCNQVDRPVFAATTLTAAFAGNRKDFEIGGFSRLALDIGYTRGGGEASSKLNLQIEVSSDRQNWYSLVIDETTTTSVITARQWDIETTAKLSILVDIANIYARVSLKEAGVVTNFGTATITYTLSGL